MPSPFEILGVPPQADDVMIRTRYLQLIREFTPEHAPDQFAKIQAAYEAIQTVSKRAERLVQPLDADITTEELVQEILTGRLFRQNLDWDQWTEWADLPNWVRESQS